MVLKLLVLMVAVAVLEGVAGLQDEQFANETQIEANPDHKKRGRRLDKLSCIQMEGKCQRIGDHCPGVVRQGPVWCLHDRYFECCYPKGCEMDGVVCPNGGSIVKCCSILACVNGDWIFEGADPNCCECNAHGNTIVPYELPSYISPTGFFSFSRTSAPNLGINIHIVSNCITDAFYTENGVTVHIWFTPGFPAFPTVTVSDRSDPGVTFSGSFSEKAHQLPQFVPPVYIVCDQRSIYIIGNSAINLHVTWNPENPWCAENVYAYAAPSVWGDLYGLCENVLDNCTARYPVTDIPDINGFTGYGDISGFTGYGNINGVTGYGQHRRLGGQHIKNQPIIESSKSEMEKACEELNNGPCIISSSEECKKFKEDCVSRMRNAIKPGQ